MAKKVLFLEDEADHRRKTVGWLGENGYDVEAFRRIDQAMERFEEDSESIACVVTDLNMSDEGLGDYRSESEGGMLSGWVWLRRFVHEKRPDMPAVVYSGFISFLEEHLCENDEPPLSKYDNIITVEKGVDENNGFYGLLRALERLAQRGFPSSDRQ